MEDSENEEPTETIKEVVEEVEDKVEKGHEEADSLVESVVQSLEAKFDQSVRSLVEGMSESSLVMEVEELIHGYQHNKAPTEENSQPKVDEKTGESTAETDGSPDSETVVASREPEENSRAIQTQPFFAVGAGSRASLANCCGLLELFKRSDQD